VLHPAGNPHSSVQSAREPADRAAAHFHSLFFCLREPKLKLSLCQSGKTNLRIAAKITTRRNNSEWSALEKPVAPPSTEPDCLPEIRFLRDSFSGAGEGI
jgi:hypothetical protein